VLQNVIGDGMDASVRQLESMHHRSKPNIFRIVAVIPLPKGTLGRIPRQGEMASLGHGFQQLFQPEYVVLLSGYEYGDHLVDIFQRRWPAYAQPQIDQWEHFPAQVDHTAKVTRDIRNHVPSRRSYDLLHLLCGHRQLQILHTCNHVRESGGSFHG
jgi:hypothetical protein